MFLYSDPKLKMQRNLGSPLAVQRLRLCFHCKGHGFDPGKTSALTIWTFVAKEMSLLFNMPSVCHSKAVCW